MKFDLVVEAIFAGLAKGKTIEDLASKHKVSAEHLNAQLKKGMKVEGEHTRDITTAKKIALDHLFEDPDYYTKLATIE